MTQEQASAAVALVTLLFTPALADDLRLFTSVGYAPADDSLEVTCGPLLTCPKFDVDVTVISLGGEVRWQIPETRWSVGAGPVLQLIDSSSVVGDVQVDTDTEQLAVEAMLRFAATRHLGLEFRVRDGSLFESLPAFDGVSLLASWHF